MFGQRKSHWLGSWEVAFRPPRADLVGQLWLLNQALGSKHHFGHLLGSSHISGTGNDPKGFV